MQTLRANPGGLSLGAIAKELGLPRSTVQRIVDALDRENLVLAPSTQSGVRLGPALLSLAAATRFEIRELARETMQALARETGETVDLSLADNDKVVFVDQVTTAKHLLAVSGVGRSFPLHCSANGKAVLASLDGAALAKVRKRVKLTAETENTITSWAVLEREIERIRAEGVAYDREENTLGVSAVSCALRVPTGELAAISIPAPTLRFVENEAALARVLRQQCDALQRKLTG